MTAKLIKFVPNPKGFIELFKSPAMQRFVDQNASYIASRASGMSGHDYGHRTHLASYTAIGNVFPNSKEAAKDNYEHNTLLKAKSGYPSSKQK